MGLDYFFLLSLGFVVGLSGALIPGPLLVYTINESLERGKWTGFKVIVGHAIVELGVFLLLIYGLLELVSTPLFVKAASILGGLALMGMGLLSLKELKTEVELKKIKTGQGVVLGGMIFTAFNPSFPVWWATAGTALLMEGYHVMGLAGMLLVLAGHWLADLGWYLFVSMTASKSRNMLFERGWYRNMRVVLSVLLLGIGAYFLTYLA